MSFSLSPHGHLHFDADASGLDPRASALLREATATATANTAANTHAHAAADVSGSRILLVLATRLLDAPLTADGVFWRDFARRYFTQLCHTPPPAEVEHASTSASIPPPPDEELAMLTLTAPPMRGAEYLSAPTLRALWLALDALAMAEIRASAGGAAAWLKKQNPLWNLVGRVTFHLAENKRDPQRPFAFLATYTHRISEQAKPQYLPLGRALQEYAGARNRTALLSLLAPVQKAAERSALVRGLVDSQRVFQPQAWTAREAHAFLQDIPALEDSGLLVRLPDWWRAGAARPRVSVTVGGKKPGGVGLDALLDFEVSLTLNGEPLSADEWARIASGNDGLVMLKGRWVEVDREKLGHVLEHWKTLESARRDGGVTMAEGLRLLAGAQSGAGAPEAASAEVREWSHVNAGGWLAETLARLRDPSAAQGEGADAANPVAVPGLLAELRPYQTAGVAWMHFLTQLGLGACLADDMGLGKTIQVLALLLRRKTEREAGTETTPAQGGAASRRPTRTTCAPKVEAASCRFSEAEPSGGTPLPLWRGSASSGGGTPPLPAQACAPALLVLPASLLGNWLAEAARFAPTLRIFAAHPSETDAEKLDALARESNSRGNSGDKSSGGGCAGGVSSAGSSMLDGIDLVITTYGMLARQAWLRARVWSMIILDEAQAIKNPGARQTRAVKELRSPVRIALTGTPVENSLGDLWSLFDFLNPGLLGGAAEFTRYTKRLVKNAEEQSASGAFGGASVGANAGASTGTFAPLRQLVRPYILRRLKSDRSVIADLPDKTEVQALCALSKKQTVLYAEIVKDLAAKLDAAKHARDTRDSGGGGGSGGSGGDDSAMQRRGLILATLMRLKQLCNHPAQLTGGDYNAAESGKFQRLAELAGEIASRQEKALVFTQFRELTGPLQHFLTGIFGRPGLVLHGATGVKDRRGLVEQFQREDGPPFFVLSLKAGGTGLTLTEAGHVIHFDRWWNPAVENQATDRAYRIGQRKNVLVHKFVCRGTLEEKIDALITSKKALAAEVLEGGGERALTEMRDEELLKFVSLDLKAALVEE